MKNTKYLFDETQTTERMVSVSQIQTYLSCRNKWKYNYIDNLTPRIERSYLTIGKLCHKGMQAVMQMLWRLPSSTLDQLTQHGLEAIYNMGEEYMGNTPMLDEEIPEFQQMRTDAASIFEQALREFNPLKYEVVTVVKNKQEIPALELHFRVPCTPSKGLHGYIDAILRDKETGFVWCTDYKFRKSLAPDDDEMFNIQNAVYAYACKKMGIEITGTKTWQHLNTPAADPQVLKTGAISRAKIKTTWEHYAEFCRQNGENPDNYAEEMQEKLADIEWYRETHEYRNEETVHEIWNACIIPVTKDLCRSRGKNAVNYRSLYPWNCKMCQYQSLCQAELRGYDVQAIKDREYTKRERTENASPMASVVIEDD